MRHSRHALLAAAATSQVFLSVSIVVGQTPVSLQEQLAAQYKVARMGSDSGGVAVVDPGTLLAIQKGGVLSVPWTAMVLCAAKYQDNNLHPSAGICAGMVKTVSKYYQKGDKVYPLKIEVSLDKAKDIVRGCGLRFLQRCESSDFDERSGRLSVCEGVFGEGERR